MARLGFWSTAQASPDSAVVHEADGRSFTAGQLLEVANQLVWGLREQGMKPGDTLAVMVSNRAEFLQLALAALQAGWYFAPLDVSSTVPELTFLLADCQPKILVVESERAQLVRETGWHADCFTLTAAEGLRTWTELWEGKRKETPPERAAGECLVYTSGSSGRPKAVRRPLGVPLDKVGRYSAVHLNAVCGIRPGSGLVHLVVSPLSHSASLMWCLDHLHLGHAVVLGSGVTGLLPLIERFRVTGMLVVPTHFYRLLEQRLETDHDLSSLKHVVHTGAACPVWLKQKMIDWWGPVLYEVYGAAEGAGTRATPKEWSERPGTVGKGFGRIRVLRPDGSCCAVGEVGEVFLKQGSRGVRYQSGEGPKSTSEGFLSVGDRGYLDGDDYLFLSGRVDEVVISGGVNVDPAEVEAVLSEHELVAEVGVFGLADLEWGERLVAAVVLRAGSPSTAHQTLMDFARGCLSGAKRPKELFFLSALPRDASGKLRRRELPDFAREEDKPDQPNL